MIRPVCALLLAALLLGVPAGIAQENGETSVVGKAEDKILYELEECYDLEERVLDVLEPLDGKERLEPDEALQAGTILAEALESMGRTFDELNAAIDTQPTTALAEAGYLLEYADTLDFDAADAIRDRAKVKKIEKLVENALWEKYYAGLCLMGRPHRVLGGWRRVVKSLGLLQTSTLVRAEPVFQLQTPEDRLRFLFHSIYEPFDGIKTKKLVLQTGWSSPDGGLRFKIKKQPKSKNRYLEMSGPKKGGDTFGYIPIPRIIYGPHQAFLTVGSFAKTEKKAEASASAIGCIEWDVVGTSGPDLSYVTFCSHLISGTQTQLFAVTKEGSRPGTVLDARMVDLLIQYVDDSFMFFARPRVPEPATMDWTHIDTITMPTVDPDREFTLGIGGTSFDSKKKKLGIDNLLVGRLTF